MQNYLTKKYIMIKKILVLSAFVFVFASCGNNSENTDNQNDTTEIITTEVAEISLASFDSLATDLVGKKVVVSGIVDHVCKHGGKKLLLVDGDYKLHVFNDKRFEEALSGSKITVTGIVEEERIDSAYLAEELKHEKGSSGDGNEADKEKMAKMTEYINMMMDSLKKSDVDHFSNYSLKFVSLEEEK